MRLLSRAASSWECHQQAVHVVISLSEARGVPTGPAVLPGHHPPTLILRCLPSSHPAQLWMKIGNINFSGQTWGVHCVCAIFLGFCLQGKGMIATAAGQHSAWIPATPFHPALIHKSTCIEFLLPSIISSWHRASQTFHVQFSSWGPCPKAGSDSGGLDSNKLSRGW